ncbi:MAG: PEP-CTERM sorting domain-containing protein [Planctomycetota bacterium]
MKRIFASATLLTAIGTASSAAIIAEETFTYADGNLKGNGSAVDPGWGGSWGAIAEDAGTTSAQVIAGEVAAGTERQRVTRVLSTGQGADGTSVFIGLDYTFSGQNYTAFELHQGGTDDGQRTLRLASTGSNVLQESNRVATNTFLTFSGDEASVSHRYVIQIDFGVGAAADKVSLYQDGVEVVSGVEAAIDMSFDRVSLAAFGSTSSIGVTDNIVIATTFAEAVPEPGSLALMGLGGLLMIKRRRRS